MAKNAHSGHSGQSVLRIEMCRRVEQNRFVRRRRQPDQIWQKIRFLGSFLRPPGFMF